MSPDDQTQCPDSGGAHHYHRDSNGVPLCSCGAVEVDAETELMLTEIAGPPFPGDRMRPRGTRRAFAERLHRIIADHGGPALDVDETLDAQDRQWREAGGDTNDAGRPLTTDDP